MNSIHVVKETTLTVEKESLALVLPLPQTKLRKPLKTS